MGWKFRDLFWVSADEEDDDTEGDVAGPAASDDAPLGESSLHAGVPEILSGLNEVEGVLGSLAVKRDGSLLGSHLPRVFDPASVARVGARLSQLRAALAADAGTAAKGVGKLSYEDFDVHFSATPSGLIGVLAERRVNVAALSMALRLVGRRLEETTRLAKQRNEA